MIEIILVTSDITSGSPSNCKDFTLLSKAAVLLNNHSGKKREMQRDKFIHTHTQAEKYNRMQHKQSALHKLS